MTELRRANAEAIRIEIQRRIDVSTELVGDCRECRAPTPRFIDPKLNNGCNWIVDVFPGVIPGCLDVVKHITRLVMSEYELIE
jgi:hypothetical protein